MEEKRVNHLEQIPQEDWGKTPTSVKKLGRPGTAAIVLGASATRIYISERTGVSAELGTALVKQQEKLFELWHRVRDGT